MTLVKTSTLHFLVQFRTASHNHLSINKRTPLSKGGKRAKGSKSRNKLPLVIKVRSLINGQPWLDSGERHLCLYSLQVRLPIRSLHTNSIMANNIRISSILHRHSRHSSPLPQLRAGCRPPLACLTTRKTMRRLCRRPIGVGPKLQQQWLHINSTCPRQSHALIFKCLWRRHPRRRHRTLEHIVKLL